MPTYYTRAQAEALLPHVEPLLREAQELMHTLRMREREMAELRQKLTGNGHLPPGIGQDLQGEIESLSAEIAQRLQAIIALDIEVKDPSIGLIDFLSKRAGRDIYLCWRLGEGDHIQWWHDLDAGYRGRQPLDD